MDALTEEEAAIYDRQLRVWGVEAQQRYALLLFSSRLDFCIDINCVLYTFQAEKFANFDTRMCWCCSRGKVS